MQFLDSPSCDADSEGPVTFESFHNKINDIVENLKTDDGVDFSLLDYDRIEMAARRKGAQSGETLDEIRRLSDILQQLQVRLKNFLETFLWLMVFFATFNKFVS